MIKGIINFIQASFGFDVPPREAIRHFESKGLKPSFSYLDVTAEEHRTAFTVAKMMDMDLLQDMQDSIRQALKQGWTYEQWADRIIPTLQANGWWGRQVVLDPVTGKTVVAELGSARRLQIIFRTNMQMAYSVGRWEQIMRQAEDAPYLMYDAVDDFRTRPTHRAWDNTILPVNHVFWRQHYPPNGWGCRCNVIQLSASELEALGLSVTDAPKITMVDWTNPRTGQRERIPAGVDAGFAYNAGQARYDDLQRLAREKAAALEDQALREAAEEGLVALEIAQKNQVVLSTALNSIGSNVQPVRTDWHDMPDVIVNAQLKDTANHPSYPAAKNGDPDAAISLVSDIITADSVQKVIQLASDKNPILVSVHAEEAVSSNFIPLAMSVFLSEKTGFEFDTSIVQSKKVGRTSAPDGFYRIAVTPTFAGEFPKGRTAIIMDDTLTQGGTFASLKGHIESQGGLVIGALALTGKQYSAKIAISAETLNKLRGSYGALESWLVGYLGYGFDKLTESEARYILGSKKDVEFVKDRIIAAREGNGIQ